VGKSHQHRVTGGSVTHGARQKGPPKGGPAQALRAAASLRVGAKPAATGRPRWMTALPLSGQGQNPAYRPTRPSPVVRLSIGWSARSSKAGAGGRSRSVLPDRCAATNRPQWAGPAGRWSAPRRTSERARVCCRRVTVAQVGSGGQRARSTGRRRPDQQTSTVAA